MRVGSTGYNPNYVKEQGAKKSENNVNKANVLGVMASDQQKSPTGAEKTENFTNYLLDRYKDFGLTVSSGITASKHGIATSYSVHPNMLKEAANDPEKAKKLDEMLRGITTIGENYFNSVNNPPHVKVSRSVHINADGSISSMVRREYSSQEARNKHHASFNINSFLEEQEELLKKDNKTSNFDYLDAIRTDFIESYREEAKQAEEASQEYSEEQQDLLEEQQKKSMLDLKI